jgi:hypothetical protein
VKLLESAKMLPSPTQPGLAPAAHYDAQVGQARLAVGPFEGGGALHVKRPFRCLQITGEMQKPAK